MLKKYYLQFKQSAFTLAETLIVMGIIGVVAALTLPNLNSSTGDKEKVAKVKKIYQNLNDALGRATAVYGPVDEWFSDGNDLSRMATQFGERLTEFMKVSKNCKMTKGCYESGIGRSGMYQFILADGTSVGTYMESSTKEFYIRIDIDGVQKGSNANGRDVFVFNVKNNSVEPERGTFSSYIQIVSQYKDLFTAASGWVIDYDNMDYLKIGSDGKCPNGTTPTESNPRCN